MPDWSRIRAEFPALAGRTYLNTATFGQLPNCATAAVAAHLERRDRTACEDFAKWFDDMNTIRELCARLVHCDASDIAFVPTAGAGLALFNQGLGWQPGDEVLTLENEFPNQLYQSAALDRFGVRYRVVPWEEFYDAVGARTRAVFLSTVNYSTGFRPPLEEISHFVEERGVLLYLDGTQSVGALELDVRRVRPAMLCVDAYKWLMSPNGAGFVYIAPELRSRLAPSVVGWRSDAGWREFSSLNHGTPVFSTTAEKYEGGMLPFASLYAMGAVIEMLLALGPSVVEERVLGLAGQVRGALQRAGAVVNTDRSQIVMAQFSGCDATELAHLLKAERISVSARHERLRVSPHLYNNEADVAALEGALSSILAARA